MLNKFNYKKKSIPKKWFFFNLAIKDNRNILFSLDKKVGVVFFIKIITVKILYLKKWARL